MRWLQGQPASNGEMVDCANQLSFSRFRYFCPSQSMLLPLRWSRLVKLGILPLVPTWISQLEIAGNWKCPKSNRQWQMDGNFILAFQVFLTSNPVSQLCDHPMWAPMAYVWSLIVRAGFDCWCPKVWGDKEETVNMKDGSTSYFLCFFCRWFSFSPMGNWTGITHVFVWPMIFSHLSKWPDGGVLRPDEANSQLGSLEDILHLAARPRDGFGYRLLPIEVRSLQHGVRIVFCLNNGKRSTWVLICHQLISLTVSEAYVYRIIYLHIWIIQASTYS